MPACSNSQSASCNNWCPRLGICASCSLALLSIHLTGSMLFIRTTTASQEGSAVLLFGTLTWRAEKDSDTSEQRLEDIDLESLTRMSAEFLAEQGSCGGAGRNTAAMPNAEVEAFPQYEIGDRIHKCYAKSPQRPKQTSPNQTFPAPSPLPHVFVGSYFLTIQPIVSYSFLSSHLMK